MAILSKACKPDNFHLRNFLKLSFTNIQGLRLNFANLSLNQTLLAFFLCVRQIQMIQLNSHYEVWSYKKRSTKKITRYRKSVQKEPTVKRYLLLLDLKPIRSQVKEKHSIGREIQSLVVRGKKLLTQTSLKYLGMVTEKP